MNEPRRGRRAAILVAVFILSIVITGLISWRLYVPSSEFQVSILDIGQGDAILLEAPTGQVILVDGGPDKTVLRRLGEELPFWERRIDLLVLTHPHEDHLAGFNSILDRYTVGGVMITGVEAKSQAYEHFLETINQKKIPLLVAEKSFNLVFGEMRLEILYPQVSFKGNRIPNLNNSSIILRAVYREFEMLLTGDAEEIEEKAILASGVNIKADVLKAGHHGSETSSSEDFIKAVNPKLVVISSGQGNSYGHPSPRTLKRLERLAIPIRRTDQEGSIHLNTDGYTISP
jgi:competence protein ComEC